jgi:hypothetical protein
VTVLSDGAEGPRGAASDCPTHHVLDWFHLAMRPQHVAQTVKGWPGSPRGAHLMLKVRTAVMNDTFDWDHVAAEWRANRPHRRAA